MAIILRKDESLDSALRRFKKEMVKSGVLVELRKREYYVTPSQKRRLKTESAKQRAKKNSTK